MNIQELVSKNLLYINLKELYIAYIYCAFQNDEKIDIIFSYFESCNNDLSLNDIFTYGKEEIKNINILLKQICQYTTTY